MKVLFLYTELAGYFLSCIDSLLKRDIEVHIVRWPVNKEAPFSFSFSDKIKIYDRHELKRKDLLALVQKISPDLILCSGWIDKDYLKVCREFRGKIPVVALMDNKWKGTLRQRIGILLGKRMIHNSFSHCWVPGNLQKEFAKRLGFDDQHLKRGFYSCDFESFHALYIRNKQQKKESFPHKLLYMGRYYEFKGIKDLWQAFSELQKENPNDWELWCLGTGTVPPVEHPRIKHFGFIQSNKMGEFAAQTGVFVLPSHVEPWGVVVHEFASAGFPLICSNEVGASEAFVRNGENGLLFKSGNITELKNVLKNIFAMTNQQLYEMGEKSASLADRITPEKWADILISFVK